MQGFITVSEFAAKLKPPVTSRRVRAMIFENRIEGAIKMHHGMPWLIPEDATDPRLWSRKRLNSFKKSMDRLHKK